MNKAPQQKRSQRTRKRILEASVTCLAEYGYSDFSTQRVAICAELSKGALFQHFPTKAGLVSATVEFYYAKIRTEGSAYFNDKKLKSPLRERITHYVAHAWNIMISPEYIGCSEVWIASRTDNKLREALVVYAEKDQYIIDLMKILPEFSNRTKIEFVNNTLISSLEGAALDYVCVGQQKNTTQYLDYLVDLTTREVERII